MSQGEIVPVSGIQHREIAPFDYQRLDPHADTIASIPELIVAARDGVVHLPENHRGIKVAAAAVAYDSDPEHPRRGIYVSGNFKARLREEERGPYDVEDISKVCAEMDVLLRAEEDGFQWLGALVVVGTTNPQVIADINHVESATLHPCRDCDSALERSSLVHPYMPVLTTGSAPEWNTYQLQSYRQYHKRYARWVQGKEFEDADVKEYIRSEWAFRRDFYLKLLRQEGIKRSMYARNAKKEGAARKLAARVMSSRLDFTDA